MKRSIRKIGKRRPKNHEGKSLSSRFKTHIHTITTGRGRSNLPNGMYYLCITLSLLLIMATLLFFFWPSRSSTKENVLNSANIKPTSETPNSKENSSQQEVIDTPSRIRRNFSCMNPYNNEDEEFYLTMMVLPSVVEDLTWGCGISVTSELMKFDVSTVYGSAGYMISDRNKLPTVTEVDTPELAVDFLSSYSGDTVVRLSNITDPSRFSYTSYYETGEDNCRQYESSEPVLACGIPGITLGTHTISVNCQTYGEGGTDDCDELIRSLTVLRR